MPDLCRKCDTPFTTCHACGIQHDTAVSHLACLRQHGDELQRMFLGATAAPVMADINDRLMHLVVHEAYWASRIDD